MKFLAFLFVALSFSSFAESARPLKKILATHTCVLKITREPVIFAKERTRTLSNSLIFVAAEWSATLRRLKVNRNLKIHAISPKYILMDDTSIASVCALDEKTKKCAVEMESLTISQIEEKSGKNVKISCLKDAVTDI